MYKFNSSSKAVNNSDSGTFFMISPFLKINPSPMPPAMPMSAALASPGPLTAQPITAIVIGVSIFLNFSSTFLARLIRSI